MLSLFRGPRRPAAEPWESCYTLSAPRSWPGHGWKKNNTWTCTFGIHDARICRCTSINVLSLSSISPCFTYFLIYIYYVSVCVVCPYACIHTIIYYIPLYHTMPHHPVYHPLRTITYRSVLWRRVLLHYYITLPYLPTYMSECITWHWYHWCSLMNRHNDKACGSWGIRKGFTWSQTRLVK